MNIQDLINSDIKKAMLARDVEKLAALRSVKSAFLLEASKDGRSQISDDIALKIISKLVKKSDPFLSKGTLSFLRTFIPDVLVGVLKNTIFFESQ